MTSVTSLPYAFGGVIFENKPLRFIDFYVCVLTRAAVPWTVRPECGKQIKVLLCFYVFTAAVNAFSALRFYV